MPLSLLPLASIVENKWFLRWSPQLLFCFHRYGSKNFKASKRIPLSKIRRKESRRFCEYTAREGKRSGQEIQEINI